MKILIIDDEKRACQSLRRALATEKEVDKITICDDALEGEKEISKNHYDVVLLDIIMPGKKGDCILQDSIKKGVNSEFIILSGSNDISTVVKCLKAGAFDYLLKPLKFELVITAIKKAYEHHNLKNSVNLFTSDDDPLEIPDVFKDFYTKDSNLKKIMVYASRLAQTRCNILITGETGTGKEVFANAIHKLSQFKGKNFVAVNVNAIPKNLFESTLFGHKKGAFSGALKDQTGLCRKADGGTLFLDEIGDLDLADQVKLLRLIEEKSFYPVGSDQLEKSEFRLVTATNKNLHKEIENGNFRQDLFYRIKAGAINLPPIRERGKDSLYIAASLVKTLCQKNRLQEKYLSPEAIFKLQSYDLPGNYRELYQLIEIAVFKSSSPIITPECIEIEETSNGGMTEHKREIMTLDEIKKDHIVRIVELYDRREDAAKALGISPRQLYKYLRKYGNTSLI